VAGSRSRQWPNVFVTGGRMFSESPAECVGIRSVAERLYRAMVDVASGTLTRAEALGHCEFAITRIGPPF
jgi:hypothetical protein